MAGNKLIWEPLQTDVNGRPMANYLEFCSWPKMQPDFNPRAREMWASTVPQLITLANPGGIGGGVPVSGFNTPSGQPFPGLDLTSLTDQVAKQVNSEALDVVAASEALEAVVASSE